MSYSFLPIDLNAEPKLLELLLLQMTAYLQEAELIGFADIPPLKDSPSTLRACGETFVGVYAEETLVAAIAFERTPPDAITICRLMVHPQHARKGLARSLLSRVEEEAARLHCRTLHVSTGAKNLPAVALYQAFGFQQQSQVEIAAGVWLSRFAKSVQPRT